MKLSVILFARSGTEIDEHVDNSCKRRVPSSSSTQSVVSNRHLLYGRSRHTLPFQFPRNPGGTEHAQTVCTRLFFLCPRTRTWERGYSHTCHSLVCNQGNSSLTLQCGNDNHLQSPVQNLVISSVLYELSDAYTCTIFWH